MQPNLLISLSDEIQKKMNTQEWKEGKFEENVGGKGWAVSIFK